MNTWLERLRTALLLSPALLLLHTWMLLGMDSTVIRSYGITTAFLLAVVSAIAEAYIIVMTINYAVKK